MFKLYGKEPSWIEGAAGPTFCRGVGIGVQVERRETGLGKVEWVTLSINQRDGYIEQYWILKDELLAALGVKVDA